MVNIKTKHNYLKLIILIFLIFFFKFPEKFYKIKVSEYENRMNSVYGYCYPQGYGFIQDIKKKYKLLNVKTINFDDFAHSDYFLNDPNIGIENKYKILINYNPQKKINFYFDESLILFKHEECYLIKND